MLSSLSEQHCLTGGSTGQVETLQEPSTEHTALAKAIRWTTAIFLHHSLMIQTHWEKGTTTAVSTDAWALRVAATEMHIA